MKKNILLTLLSLVGMAGAQPKNENTTYTYPQLIEAYRQLDDAYANARLMEAGPTDAGRKLHLLLIGGNAMDKEQGLADVARGKTVLLINNGIHPGESCGIDASLLFAKEILQTKLPPDVLVAIVPVYNIGGMLNRGTHSRANQNGPEEYGFRGNARNLDLNRDFIKADALNTLSFYAIFQALKPHIFIDTHTSNGADYQYTMTLISTQKDKLNPVLATLLADDLEPYLYQQMQEEGYPMSPYVNVFGYTPDKGFTAFLETPRYASGYTALFNTIGFVSEAHMLKPYPERVEATRKFLHVVHGYTTKNSALLRKTKNKANAADRVRQSFALNWALDSAVVETLDFKGYAYSYEPSSLHNGQRLRYDAGVPKSYPTPYYPAFKPTDSATVPTYYVLPAAWHQVAQRLQYNGITMLPLAADTTFEVNSYYVASPQFLSTPYEGHFVLTHASVEQVKQARTFLKGDLLIPTDQAGRQFIVNTLEPLATDSYLRWNFFDEIYQQKEYFSPYVFEDTAAQLLKDNPELQAAYEKWKSENPAKAANAYAALMFIYQRSPYYEKEHLRYPVARVE